MFWFYLKIAVRNLLKGKWINLINLVGLSISLTIVILLTTYISSELDKGKSQPGYESVYQVRRGDSFVLSYPMIKLIRDKIPESKAITGIHQIWATKKHFIVNDTKYDCTDFIYADSLFFNVFEQKVLYGELKGALSSPDGIVLTQSISKRFFGNENPVGKEIVLNTTEFGKFTLKIKAVIKDLPKGSILKYNGLISTHSLDIKDWYKQNLGHWGQMNYSAFARIDVNPININQKLNEVFKETAPKWIQQDSKPFSLLNYRQIYFDPASKGDDLGQHNSLPLIKILGLISLVILLTSWINYINLSSATLEVNTRAYDIQKHLGASFKKLMLLGIIDTLPIVCFALLISLIIVRLLIPAFNYLIGTTFLFTTVFSGENALYICTILLSTILVCGLIPVLIQKMRYSPEKQPFRYTIKAPVRNALITFQFFISITFIIATGIMIKQSRYMLQFPTGFSSENIMHLNTLSKLADKKEAFLNEIKQIPGVIDVTSASDIICNVQQEHGVSMINKGLEKRIQYSAMQVDKNFFNFFGLKLIKGQTFGESSIKEVQHIFNHTAIKNYGIEKLNDARITAYSNARGDIIGEVENFHYKSMHSPVSNLGFMCQDQKYLQYLYIKSNTSSPPLLQQIIKRIEGTWNKFVPDWPVEIGFLDESIKKMYEQDIRLNEAFTAAAVVSILVACMGLLGMSIFNVDRRTKEIGIRKINGARIHQVMLVLNQNIIKCFIVALVIACPLVYYVMNKWLQNFAYKTELSWWIFVLGGMLVLIIALLTISWQSWKAATKNPVKALRYE
jgi:putative ABC transport system permease protein